MEESGIDEECEAFSASLPDGTSRRRIRMRTNTAVHFQIADIVRIVFGSPFIMFVEFPFELPVSC